MLREQGVVILGSKANIQDAELAALGTCDSATLTLVRQGGANSDDVFSARGSLTVLTPGSYFAVDGVTIGRVLTNSGGILQLQFLGANATQARVDKAMQQIAYTNTSDRPPPQVLIDWTFDDGNTGAQGTGGALSTTGTVTVNITPVNDAPRLVNAPSIQTAIAGRSFSYTLPDDTFSDPDGDALTYMLTMANGTAIPPWLVFNSATRTLSGTPSQSEIGSLNLKVTAKDPANASAMADLTISIMNSSLTASVIASNKTYDGTTTATITACNLDGVSLGDAVNCSVASANFSDANAGTNKTVTATGITLGGADAGKYTLMNTTATTTADILKAPATVTLANLTQTYTGSPISPSATTSPASLAFTWTGAPQTNAGSYPVTATIHEQNYQGSASDTFVIQPAPATVTLADLSQTYTGLPLSPSVTTVPAGLTYSLSGAPQTNAGTYPVTGTMTNPNYSGTASGTFVIAQVAQAPVFISAPASAMYQQAGLSVFGYGGSGTGSFTYSAASSTACSVDALTGALSITSGSGLCQVTATRAGDQNHLPASSIAANILVVKAPQAALTVSATPGSVVSGGAGSTLSSVGGSTGGPVTYAATASPGLTCTISGSTLTASGGAGTCSVTASMAGNANYEPVTSAALAVPVVLETGPSGLFSAVLPYARSVPIGQPATAFGTLINATGVDAIGCALALPVSPAIPATFNYQTTNASNQLVGTPNTPVNIPAWGSQSFIFGITPGAAFAATDIPIVFDCANTQRAPSQVGLNTFLLSASSTPVPDMVAIGATPSGDGVLRIPGSNGLHAFGTAAVNIGGAGEITATVDTGGVPLPLALTVCQTHPVTGACVFPPAASTTRTLANNASATYAVFAQASGAIPLDPAGKRIFLRLSSGGVVRGATSVAVTTQ